MRYLKEILLSVFFSGTFIIYSQQKLPVYLDVTKPIEQRVENALSLMTTREKVDLCHAQSKFSSKGVPRLGIPELWMDDGPMGIREEVYWDEWNGAHWTNDSCTAFPALTCLAATFNPKMAYLYGKSIGEEARYRNKSVLLGPGVNIYRTPLGGRNFEFMGEDPFLASQMVVPYIRGVQSNGVAACVKHFALNNQETWRGDVDVNVSDRALHEIYLPAFKAAVTKGKAWAIMGSYNQFRGEHCCENNLLLNKILKGRWKFDGVVISDWGGVHNTTQAVNNGLDIEMGTYTNGLTTNSSFSYSDYYLANPYLKGLKGEKYSISGLNDKARRILRLIFRTAMNTHRPWGSFATAAHAEADRKIADEGIVLLKDEDHILPIVSSSIKTIAVIGENATHRMTIGGGSSSLKVKQEIVPLEGLQARFGNEYTLLYSIGYSSEVKNSAEADSLRQAAINVAKKADIVLFIGGLNKDPHQDCEGTDRLSYGLPYGQDQLIDSLEKVNKHVVVVLVSGNAVAMPWANDVQAIVQAWYLGSQAGNAIADILSGDVNPSGKLPFTFPVKLSDCGAHSFGAIAYPGIDKKEVYKEGILVGYRWYDTKHIRPLFPFGFGLSYTTFAYSKPEASRHEYALNDTIHVRFRLTNSGKRAGAETAQLYVSKPQSKVMRAEKELKAFQKVFLQPGETKAVILSVPVKSLAYYDEAKNGWIVEPGAYNLLLASSSSDIKGEASVVVK
ncbi:beta-glucosidase [Microbacter margulisiae]|uniref:Beta-glucosidase n=1 Tax=Microbacter margulisiae TaxID=1350067 RepID=A0A7W5DTF8_9PORP|nr:glycoside hydrolase family 3 C-terminal domain-containing protein [Microbacter margulisiae]MBB3188772.1 beta-glucosidase [Microbacter margulisiae]